LLFPPPIRPPPFPIIFSFKAFCNSFLAIPSFSYLENISWEPHKLLSLDTSSTGSTYSSNGFPLDFLEMRPSVYFSNSIDKANPWARRRLISRTMSIWFTMSSSTVFNVLM
jgi:hypothetical protein